MPTYVLSSAPLAERYGTKTFEVTNGDQTIRVEGLARSPDPNRSLGVATEVVAEGEKVRFVSSNEKRLEASGGVPSTLVAPEPSF